MSSKSKAGAPSAPQTQPGTEADGKMMDGAALVPEGGAAAAAAIETGAGGEGGGDAAALVASTGPALIVTCLVAAGRRRAGRRWGAGDTPVAAGSLSAAELEELAADPLLRVREGSA